MVTMHTMFGIIWQFVVVTKIFNWIKKEFVSQAEGSFGLPTAEIVTQLGKRPTYQIDIVHCVVISVGIILNFFSFDLSSIPGEVTKRLKKQILFILK